MQNLYTIHNRLFMTTIIIWAFAPSLKIWEGKQMSRTADYPADREEICAPYLVWDGVHTRETLEEVRIFSQLFSSAVRTLI